MESYPRVAVERILAEKYGVRVLNFPLIAGIGRHIDEDYETIAALAAEAIAREPDR